MLPEDVLLMMAQLGVAIAGFNGIASALQSRERRTPQRSVIGSILVVGDALDARRRSGVCEGLGRETVALLEVFACAHRVDQIVGGLYACEGAFDDNGIGDVPADDLGRRQSPTPEFIRASHQAPDRSTFGFEAVEQAPADVARRAGQQDQDIRLAKSQLEMFVGEIWIAISSLRRESSRRAKSDSRVPT